ncbi:hypothetical protein LOK74_14100 [Brevibacillus humidisoli]|uniref:hypothetical protein n=1 Tax=Brevibacillus humidisoli TaxID=2895522 RepID=UPI001E56258A|nr:hypothetical protein [Brevibacillus humidisoli]UFJ39201.1 hypothetical protein LOK74_14100 [Brevibacillus humidisoli]
MFKKQKRKFKKGKYSAEFKQFAAAKSGVGNAAAINQATAFGENEKKFKKKTVHKKEVHKKKDFHKKDFHKKDFHKKDFHKKKKFDW